VHGKKRTTTKQPQTLEFSHKCYFLLYIIFKTLVCIRFGDPSLHSIDLTGCCILGEKHIWFETHMIVYLLALCSRGVFSLRIALCVPQPRLFLLLTSFIFYLLFIIIIIILLLIVLYLWLIFFDSYTCHYYYYSNNYYYIISYFGYLLFE